MMAVIRCPQCDNLVDLDWDVDHVEMCEWEHWASDKGGDPETLLEQIDAFFDSTMGQGLIFFAVLSVGLIAHGVLLRWTGGCM